MLKFGRSLQWFDFVSEVIQLQHATQTPMAGVQGAHGPRNPFQTGNKQTVLDRWMTHKGPIHSVGKSSSRALLWMILSHTCGT
ncbi:hypothetical protein CapIbe_008838 [Capra ibex]